MNEMIKEYLNDYMESNNLELNEQEYKDAYNGIKFWLTSTIPEAVSDSVMSALG